jgi:hypothetical protein
MLGTPALTADKDPNTYSTSSAQRDKMKKTLQFDYFPLLRSSYDANEFVTEGLLKDELNVYWNKDNIFKDIQSSKETAENGFIKRTVDIELLDENKLVLDNTQTWHNEESIKLNAEINLNRKEEDVWNLQFLYNLTTTNNDDYKSFNEKFGILDEMFHFKLNGEALLVNEKVQGGRRIFAEKEFFYTGMHPIMFELEEYGTGLEQDSRFIQIVRFTI